MLRCKLKRTVPIAKGWGVGEHNLLPVLNAALSQVQPGQVSNEQIREFYRFSTGIQMSRDLSPTAVHFFLLVFSSKKMNEE